MEMFNKTHKCGVSDTAIDILLKTKDLVGPEFQLEEHQKWLEEKSKQQYKVTVSEPETRGSYLKKYTAYLVSLQPQEKHVRRRFSEFEWLHGVLQEGYIGMLIPSIPEKNMIQSEAVIRSRVRSLTLFLEKIVASPYLMNDKTVVAFLTTENDEEWEEQKQTLSVLENAGDGHLHWVGALVHSELPPDIETWFASQRRQGERQEQMLDNLYCCSKCIAERSNATHCDIKEMHKLFADWKSTHSSSLDNYEEKFLSFLNETITFCGSWSDMSRMQPAVFNLLLYENLKFMHQQAKDYTTLLANRETAQQYYQKCSKFLDDKEKGKLPASSGFASKFMSSITSNEMTPMEAEMGVKRSECVVHFISQAIYVSEAEKFKLHILNALEELFTDLACAQVEILKKQLQVWEDYLATRPGNQEELKSDMHPIMKLIERAESSSNQDDN